MRNNLPYNVMRNPNSWDNVPRMPQAIAAAVTGFSTFAAASAAGSAFAYAAVYVGAYIGVSAVTSWAISALAPKPDFSSFGSQGTLVNTRDATAAADFVYGEVRKGGTITYYEATGDQNKYLHQIIVLAAHEVEEIGDIYLNDQVVTIGEDFVDTVGGDIWKNKVLIQKYDGSQTLGPRLLFVSKGLTGSALEAAIAEFAGKEIAYLYIRYEYDAEVFANGLPLVTAKIKGKKVYDPRTGVTGYSNNAALCIRDFIISEYGLNDSAVDDVVFSAAANECDEDVRRSESILAGNFIVGQQYEIRTNASTDFTLIGASSNDIGTVFIATGAGSGTSSAWRSEKRYTINGIIKASSPIGDVLGKMTTACAGTLFWGSGYWKLKVGAYSAPVKTLTLDDLRGPINLNTRSSMRDSFNGVSGTFNDAENDFITMDYPPIKSSTFKTEDGGDEILLDLPLPFTTSGATAQRIAKMTLYRGREQMTINADFGLEAFNVEVGDIIAFTNERYGFDEKEFEVIGWKFASNQEAGDLRVNLTLQETSEAAFDWNAEESAIVSNNTTLPDFNTVSLPTNLTLTAQAPLNGDGSTAGSILVEWDASVDAFVDYYEVQHKIAADAEYSGNTTTLTSHTIAPTISSTLYDVRVRGVSGIGVKSEWVEATVTSARDEIAPAVPTVVLASAGYRQNIVNWTNPSDLDLSFVQVYANTVNNSSTAGIIGTIKGTEFVHGDLPEQTQRYYWLKSVDTSGNISGFSSVVSATTLADPQDGADGADGAPGADGTDGTDGDTVVTGRVYYQTLQASAPSAPSATSYDTTTGTFSGLTSGWLQTQPSVDITDTSVQEWSSQFLVSIDGTTSAQTLSFSPPDGAIQVTADIESDNYVAGSSGWRIERDTGNAEFQNAIIRGTLNATDISAGTLTADRINLTGSQLESSSGALIVSDSGIDTPQIADLAVTDSFEGSSNSGSVTGSGISNFTDFITITFTNSSIDNRFLMQANLQIEGSGSGQLYVIFGTTGLSPNLGADILFAGSGSFYPTAGDVLGFFGNSRVVTGLPVGSVTVTLRGAADTGSSFDYSLASIFVAELKK